MRIAMLSWESLHSIAVGGVAAHVTELAAALERKGHDVHVFTRMGQGQKPHDLIHGVHYHRCPMHLQKDFVEEVNGMCESFAHHFAIVEDAIGQFDVVHAHDWLAANAMIWIKQRRGRPGVLTMHSTDYGRSGNVFHGGQSERVRHQERAGTYWADKVIAVSHATKGEVTWMYEVPEEKVAVVYNGVSNHRFEGAIDPGAVKQRYGIGPLDPTVLFCGRLVQQKGPDLFVEALPSVLHYYPDAKFVFAGDGSMRSGLQQRAGQLGIEHAVRFLGHRDGQELVELFKMTDALCVPSRNEPFGIVVLEAWSAGKPVIATMNGGPNEYVRHEVDGLKIYANADSCAWGLGTLFADWEKARAMGQSGKEAVAQSFTWEVIAGQTLDVYDSLPSRALPQPRPQVLVPAEPVEEMLVPSRKPSHAHPDTWVPAEPAQPAGKRRRRRSRSGSALAGRI
jgi:glycosyltransferase involved in cell wall biosynthesis